LIVASANGRVGIVEAMECLRRGGSALDAVEVGVRAVESNPNDHSVGLGGLPNMLGEIELDASIMDGRTLAAGAVGALKGYEHPISVARKVMEELPHVFLVGEGAERFAAEMGFPRVELLTEEARRIWQDRLAGYGLDPSRLRYLEAMRERVRMTADPENPKSTLGELPSSGVLKPAVPNLPGVQTVAALPPHNPDQSLDELLLRARAPAH
jgi:beta-aspartyl-peptidase (threonine type)